MNCSVVFYALRVYAFVCAYCEHPTAKMCVGVFRHADHVNLGYAATVLVRPSPALVREFIASEGAPVAVCFDTTCGVLLPLSTGSGSDFVYADGERYCQLQWGAKPCRVSSRWN